MSKETTIPHRRYTDEFKREAIRLAESVGGNEAARRLGIPDSSLGNSIKGGRAGKWLICGPRVTGIKHPTTELEAENARLRRELASARLDLDIVKKAAVYWAKESR